MKKSIIGGLVGGFIIFMWQFLSWSALNIHGSQMSYTPHQDQIMNKFMELNLEEGQYMMPNLAPGYTAEEQAAYAKNMEGQPWALLTYNKKWSNTMPMNMVRAFIIDVLSAFLLCFLLLGQAQLNFMKVLTGCLIVGIISYLTIPYLNTIWFKTDSIPDLIDAIVQWGLVGAFLGWYLPTKK
jgi:hypothetical protein